MMAGHEFLMKEFGVVPRNAWLLDEFGHSAANTRLFADMGLEAIFINRITMKENEKRWFKKDTNFVWRPFSKHFGD